MDIESLFKKYQPIACNNDTACAMLVVAHILALMFKMMYSDRVHVESHGSGKINIYD